MLNLWGGKFEIYSFIQSLHNIAECLPDAWCRLDCVLTVAHKQVWRIPSCLKCVSLSKRLIKNQIVKLTVDVHLCVISPWKERFEVPCGALAEMLV